MSDIYIYIDNIYMFECILQPKKFSKKCYCLICYKEIRFSSLLSLYFSKLVYLLWQLNFWSVICTLNEIVCWNRFFLLLRLCVFFSCSFVILVITNDTIAKLNPFFLFLFQLDSIKFHCRRKLVFIEQAPLFKNPIYFYN